MELYINKEIPIIKNNTNANKIKLFTSTDKENQYEENKKKLGVDWYYYDKEIIYQYNSWGYRTKEFVDLEDDYILVFGCSCTEGVGIHNDDLWSTKLGKKLNLDVFNLGMGSTGIDYQFYNTMLFQNFILKNKKLPKLVVYQWPADYRSSTMYKHRDELRLDVEIFSPHSEITGNKISDTFFEWYKMGFIENGGDLLKQKNFYPMICNNTWEMLNIPVLHWSWDSFDDYIDYSLYESNFKIHFIHDNRSIKARDLSHDGHCAHEEVSNFLMIQLSRNGFSK